MKKRKQVENQPSSLLLRLPADAMRPHRLIPRASLSGRDRMEMKRGSREPDQEMAPALLTLNDKRAGQSGQASAGLETEYPV